MSLAHRGVAGEVEGMLVNRPARLDGSTLDRVSAGASSPTYDRGAARIGVAHIGVGSFHRSHQAVYMDDLLHAGRSDWGIAGIGLLSRDAAMRDVLARQDGLYTLLLKAPDGTVAPRVIGSILEYHFAPEGDSAALDRLAAPSTRLVTLTVTETGYGVDPTTGAFDADAQAVRADLERAGPARTHFRLLTDALRLRRDAGTPPFTVLSCDNLIGNGEIARRTLLAYARLADPELADWIAEQVAFPGSMVDRITPATVDADRELARDAIGLEDAWPVAAESYRQWVVEDQFTGDGPPLDAAGVLLVRDVAPYERMKLRLLNAGHQLLGHLGGLLGHDLGSDAMRDPVIASAIERFHRDEARPTVGRVPGIDLDDYCISLRDRFANAALRDTTARLRSNASNSIPAFLLPIVRDARAQGRRPVVAVATIAAWARLSEERTSTSADDPHRGRLRSLARNPDLGAFLTDEQIFGDLRHDRWLRSEFVAWRAAFRSDRALHALAALR